MKLRFIRATQIVALAVSLALILPLHADSSRPKLNGADRDYLIKVVAASYPDVSFGARVAIISVVMNRVASADYPDTAAGALASFGDMFDLLGVSHKIDTEVLHLTSDAMHVVENGADPTDNCTSFVCLERVKRGGKLISRIPLDLFFNDYSEENIKKEILSSMSHCKIIIDGIGFY